MTRSAHFTAPSEELIHVGEVELECFFSGPESAEHTLLLVHGWTYGARMWAPFQSALADHGHRSVAVNCRGAGQSTVTPDDRDYTSTQFALDLKQLVERLGVGRFHLMGQCMGGVDRAPVSRTVFS